MTSDLELVERGEAKFSQAQALLTVNVLLYKK